MFCLVTNQRIFFPQCFPCIFLSSSSWKMKINSYWSKTVFFFLSLPVEKENNKFSSQNIGISSQNNVLKYHPRRHEKDLSMDKYSKKDICSETTLIGNKAKCNKISLFLKKSMKLYQALSVITLLTRVDKMKLIHR